MIVGSKRWKEAFGSGGSIVEWKRARGIGGWRLGVEGTWGMGDGEQYELVAGGKSCSYTGSPVAALPHEDPLCLRS